MEDITLNEGGSDPVKKKMTPKHLNLLNLHNECHGLDKCADKCGGLAGREQRFGSRWRAGVVNPQHFSGTKRAIVGVRSCAMKKSISQVQAVAELKNLCSKDCKKSIANFVDKLKGVGLVDKRAPRFNKKKAAAAAEAVANKENVTANVVAEGTIET